MTQQAITLIYAEKLDKPGGQVIEKGVFLSLLELAEYDANARKVGAC